MIKKFIDKLLGKTTGSRAKAGPKVKGGIPLGKRVEVPHSEHRIDLALVDERAIKVVQTLAKAGHEAYIVGGAVRDLLLGLRPKDFDVATNATPEQVKALFRRAFIIGRRFRIVHVVYGRGREHEVIEVSTFRAMVDAEAAPAVAGNEKTSQGQMAGKSHVVDAEGRVLRDNVWGPQIEDAARRDFTINAMYYDPQSQIVVDYHGGMGDSKKKLLRMIGDPDTRYREDPVRIIRVVRFAAKLGFEIEAKTRQPIREMAALLENVPPSRLFDEMFKLLQTGHSIASLAELRKQGLLKIFPVLEPVLAQDPRHAARHKFMALALADTDRRVSEDKPVAPSFLLACLLWHDVLGHWDTLKRKGDAPIHALQQAVDAVFDARVGEISGRGKLGADMREIWMMQTRFERRGGNGPHTLVEQARFRAGFDFLRLRADAGEVDASLAEWWEDFSMEDADGRQALIEAVRRDQRGRPQQATEEAEYESPAEGESSSERTAPARKRRRRRKPAGAGAGGAATPSGGERAGE